MLTEIDGGWANSFLFETLNCDKLKDRQRWFGPD